MNRKPDSGTEMNREPIIRYIATAVFAVAVFVFFLVFYRGHLHYHEQMQMFVFTGAYAAEVIGVPGGLADYVARFLTQFFVYGWSGALVMTILVTSVQLICLWLCGRRTGITGALSFVPAVLVWMQMCDGDAMPSVAVSLILSALAAKAVTAGMGTRPCVTARSVATVVLTPIIYMTCGPIGLLFVVLAALKIAFQHESGAMQYALLALAAIVGALCPVVSAMVFPYQTVEFWCGIHYYRYTGVGVPLAWLSALAMAVIVAIGVCCPVSGKTVTSNGKRRLAFTLVAYAAVAAFAGFGIFAGKADYVKENVMEFDRLACSGDWKGIIDKAGNTGVDSRMQAVYLNLALMEEGRLNDELFRYTQHGTDGLFQSFGDNYLPPLATAEVYYRLGAVKAARYFIFDVHQSVPDHQKSTRCMRRLAETHIIDGEYELARKYLKALQGTLFHSAWAEEMLALCEDDNAVDSHPEYGNIRKIRGTRPVFFDENDLRPTLISLLESNPGNEGAYSYLLAYCMLSKDLPALAQCVDAAQDSTPLPVAVQEALTHYWASDHTSLAGIPWPISDDVKNRFMRFLKSYRRNMTAETLSSLCGNTYWEYQFLN